MPLQDTTTSRSAPGARRKRVIQGLLAAAVVVAAFAFGLPKIADFSEVWKELKAMSYLELGSILLLAVWNIATYWFVVLASLPDANIWQVMKVVSASTAVSNSMPGGGAIGVGVTYGMYSNYGFKKADVSLSILVTGLWNNFVKLGMPVIALALLAISGDATGALLLASLIGIGMLIAAIALFAMTLKSERAARAVGRGLARVVSKLRRLFRKEPVAGWDDGFARFRSDAIGLLRTRWLWLTLATLVSHLSLYVVLLVSLRHVGVSESEVTWIETLAAFSFIRLITALPVTPGGVGVVELGATAALVAAGGDRAGVVAAVLVYRALTYLLPIPLGLMMYLRWQQHSGRRRAQRDAEAALGPREDPVNEPAP